MGVTNTKIKCLKSNELLEFSKVSTFTQEEINDLYLYFNQLSKAQKDDGVIDYEEFCMAIGLQHGLYSQNLFKIFDTNDDKVINFREFIIAFATFLNETIDKQIKLSFRIYDPEDKGYVDKATILEIMKDAIKGLGTLELPDDIIEEIVEETFRDVKKYSGERIGDFAGQSAKKDAETKHKEIPEEIAKGDIVTFDMYEKMVYENNDIIKWLAIDLHRVCQGAKLISNDKAVIKNINNH